MKSRRMGESRRATAKTTVRESAVTQPEWGIWNCLLVFFLAAAVRILYLAEIRDADAFSLLLGDAHLFDTWAREIAGGNWIGNEVFFNAPLYPYLLALVYWISGSDPMAMRFVQIGIGSLSCVCVLIAGSHLFSRRVGVLGGFLLALYPTAVFMDCLIQKEFLALFLFSLMLVLLSRPGVSRGSTAFWMGVTLGFLTLVRENALLILLAVTLVMGIRLLSDKKQAIRWMLFCCLGASLVWLPVAVRNVVVGDEFVLITANSGFNFYIGNHRQATGSYTPVIRGHGDWQDERRDASAIASRDSAGDLTASEISGYWYKRAFAEIREDVPRWIGLLVKKWFLVWNSAEIGDSESQYVYEDESILLRLLAMVFHFGVLGPLAVFGMALTWRKDWRVPLAATLVFLYMASIAMFFVFGRFRYPIVAVLIPFAAAGLVEGLKKVRQSGVAGMIVPLGWGLAAAVAMNFPMVSAETYRATTWYNIAVSLEKQGRMDSALGYYRKTIEADPHQAMAYTNLGILLFQKGMVDEAGASFHQAAALDSKLSEPLYNLGIWYFHQGEMERAAEYFRKTVDLNPDYDPAVYYNLACVYSRMNQTEQAAIWLVHAIEKGYSNRRAIETDPDLENLRGSDEFRKLGPLLPSERTG